MQRVSRSDHVYYAAALTLAAVLAPALLMPHVLEVSLVLSVLAMVMGVAGIRQQGRGAVRWMHLVMMAVNVVGGGIVIYALFNPGR